MGATFTEHQVRAGLMEVCEGDVTAVNDCIDVMRDTPAEPGAVGFTDDELKGVARDEWAVHVDDSPEPVTWAKVQEWGVSGPVRQGLAERLDEGSARSVAAALVNRGIEAEARHHGLSTPARPA